MPAPVPLPLTSTRTTSNRWPDRLRCATTKSPENWSPYAERMADVAFHPGGRSGRAPPEAIRSRSSANIRSPPNPRVPTTERHRAATNMIPMHGEEGAEGEPRQVDVGRRQPPHVEEEGRAEHEVEATARVSVRPAATTTGNISAIGTSLG